MNEIQVCACIGRETVCSVSTRNIHPCKKKAGRKKTQTIRNPKLFMSNKHCQVWRPQEAEWGSRVCHGIPRGLDTRLRARRGSWGHRSAVSAKRDLLVNVVCHTGKSKNKNKIGSKGPFLHRTAKSRVICGCEWTVL